jgi:hypothetical protein
VQRTIRATLRDRVAFDRLASEGAPFGLPVFQRAVFKAQVERLAVIAGWDDARILRQAVERTYAQDGGENRQVNPHQRSSFSPASRAMILPDDEPMR